MVVLSVGLWSEARGKHYGRLRGLGNEPPSVAHEVPGGGGLASHILARIFVGVSGGKTPARCRRYEGIDRRSVTGVRALGCRRTGRHRRSLALSLIHI